MIKKEDIDNRVVLVAVITTLVTLAVIAKLFIDHKKSNKSYAKRGDDFSEEDLDWDEGENE